MERQKMLLMVAEELLEEKMTEIGWDADGSEIDLITMSPEWEAAVSGSNLEQQILDLIEVINTWGKNTKMNYMHNGKRIEY